MSLRVVIVGTEAYYVKKIVSTVFDLLGVANITGDVGKGAKDFNFYTTKEGVLCGEPDPSRPLIPFSEDEARAVWLGCVGTDILKNPEVFIKTLISSDLGRDLVELLESHADVYEFQGYNKDSYGFLLSV